jgi:hypothetical protein
MTEGSGVTRDACQTMKWFKIAAKLGHVEAQKALETVMNNFQKTEADAAFVAAEKWLASTNIERSDYDLENTWIDFKASLLTTSAYGNGTNYPSLYDHCNSILIAIMGRHWHFVLDAEARLNFNGGISGNVLRRITVTPENVPIEALPGLILAAYIGGKTRTSAGEFFTDPRWGSEAIDYLIYEKQSPIGLFLKGVVLKYGIELYLPPNLEAAKQFLEAGLANGIGSSEIELQNIAYHKNALSNIESVHPDHNEYQKWVSQASLENVMWCKNA